MKDMLGNGKDVTLEQLKMDQLILQGQQDELQKELNETNKRIAEFDLHLIMSRSKWEYHTDIHLKGFIAKGITSVPFKDAGVSISRRSGVKPKNPNHENVWLMFTTADAMKDSIRKYDLKISFNNAMENVITAANNAITKLKNMEDWADWYEELRDE